MPAKDKSSVLQNKIQHLECYVLQQNKMQDVLKEILAATVNKRGELYFQTLVSRLADILEVRYAFIAEIVSPETARTIALWADGQLSDNITYSLKGSPCVNVVETGFCIYPENVQQKFPQDSLLVEMEAESYIGTPLQDANGKPIGVLALLDDKPFRQVEFAEFLMTVFAIPTAAEIYSIRAEEEIREHRDEWESSFNAIDDMVTIQDKDMRIVRANRSAASYVGVGTEQLIGRYCYEAFRGRTSPCDNCPELLTLQDKQNHSGIIKHENSGRVFLVSTSAILDEHDHVKNVVHVAKDITFQKDLEEELYQARKMEAIGTLAGGIAHDFNNILTGVLGYAELLKDDIARGNVKSTAKIDNVIKGALRARDLVSQILTFSRRSIQQPLPLKSHLIINESLKLLRSTLPSTVEINQVLDKECGMIVADPTKLQQVLMNLCTNALQAMENEKGVLTVTLRDRELTRHDLLSEKQIKPGKFVELAVSDTGHGIEQKNLKRIFEPYFTTRGMGRGTGLGLALVHGVVRDHGGLIKVESVPGKGTSFRIYFPVVQETEKQHSSYNSAPNQLSGTERILLVDDENSVVEVIQEGLSRLGYKVQATTDSEEALHSFCVDPFAYDLVITDQTMPNITGVELAQKMLQVRKDIPIILCTGYSSVVSKTNSAERGIREFVMKPLEMNVLATVVRKVLDQVDTDPSRSIVIS